MKKTLASFSCFNPRREAFDVTDASQDRVQIPWEFRMLRLAHLNLFYFSHETFAPITLWELGAALERSVTSGERNIYVALHPEYKRRNDVIIQTEQIRADSPRLVGDKSSFIDFVPRQQQFGRALSLWSYQNKIYRGGFHGPKRNLIYTSNKISTITP